MLSKKEIIIPLRRERIHKNIMNDINYVTNAFFTYQTNSYTVAEMDLQCRKKP